MNKKEFYQKLDNLENKISKLENRITKLENDLMEEKLSKNTTNQGVALVADTLEPSPTIGEQYKDNIYEVYKENEKGVFSWRQQGYFGSLQNCTNAVKSYVLLNEINNHTLAEVKEILNKIDSIKVQIIDLTEEPKKLLKESKHPNIYKSLMRLSKLTKKLHHPVYNGAFFMEGNTYIVNTYFMLKVEGQIEGLEMIDAQILPKIDKQQLERILTIPSDATEVTINVATLKENILNKLPFTDINGYKFDTKQLYTVLKCFEDAPYSAKLIGYRLYIQGIDKIAVVAGQRY